MNRKEFVAWFDKFGIYFPMAFKKIKAQADETRKAWLEAWLQKLETVSPEEAEIALQRMVNSEEGDGNLPEWELHRLGVVIWKHVQDTRKFRSERESRVRLRREAAEARRHRKMVQAGVDPASGEEHVGKTIMSGGVLRQAGLAPAFREIEERVSKGEDRRDVTYEICEQVRRGER